MRRYFWTASFVLLGACVQSYNPFPDPPDFRLAEFSGLDRPSSDFSGTDQAGSDVRSIDAGSDFATDGAIDGNFDGALDGSAGPQDASSDSRLPSDFAYDAGLQGDSGAATLFFSAAKQYAAQTGFTLRAVRIARLNADAPLDAVAVSNGLLEVFFGDGQGGFTFHTELVSGQGSLDISIDDWNGDTIPDLVVPAFFSELVNLRLGSTMSGYLPQGATGYPVGGGPSALVSTDLNADKKLDLVVANSTDNTLSVLLGKGDGTLNPENRFTSTTTPNALAYGDFNGDKKIDVVSANSGSDNVALLLGDGMGGLLAPIYTAVGVQPVSIVVADFDSDKNLDVATANANSVTVLFGKGDGTFTLPALQIPLNVNPRYIATGDLDRDGIADLVLPVSTSNFAVALLGIGGRQFAPVQSIVTGIGTNAVAINDLNGDSKPDLVFTADATNPTVGALVVVLNQTP